MGSEIERKFYCDPEKRAGKRVGTKRVEQGYLPDTGSTEIRLRRPGTLLTLKNGHGTQRFEWEVPLRAGDFDGLWPRTEGARVAKIRDSYAWKGFTIEVDRYEGPLEGLVTAEVEFGSLEEACGFKPPPMFGPELTWDPRFKNRSLAANPDIPLMTRGVWSYGVLPYTADAEGIQLVAITTRRHDRWIVPKGQPEPGHTPEQVALIEAREEAGLTGRITGHALVLPYARETGITNLLLFPMLVMRLADRWLEAGQRERRLVPLTEAGDYGDVVRLGAQALLETLGTLGS
jgi:CYTH domain-containing protein/8-oxo-dGTP pyrophosphatase MutT (NUDIX family)